MPDGHSYPLYQSIDPPPPPPLSPFLKLSEAVWENQSHIGKVSFGIQAQKCELDDPWSKLNEHHSRKVEPFLHILTKVEL